MSSALSGTMRRRTITAFFDQRSDAEEAIGRLVALGIPRGSVRIVPGAEQASRASVSAQATNELGFWDALKDLFLPDDDRATYAEGLRRGGYLVTAQVEDAYYDRAIDVLDDEGTIDIDQRAQAWRSEGWTGQSALGAGSFGGQPARARSGAATASQNLTADQQEVIPVTEEQLRVGKREVSHGRVRVRSYVVETPVQEQVGLREEHVTIQRRPVDRPVTGTENLFRDRVIEAEERVEEAVVAKEARVKEEVVIGKTAEQRTQTISDTVRRTEVEVEDERGGTTRTGMTGTGDRKQVS